MGIGNAGRMLARLFGSGLPVAEYVYGRAPSIPVRLRITQCESTTAQCRPSPPSVNRPIDLNWLKLAVDTDLVDGERSGAEMWQAPSLPDRQAHSRFLPRLTDSKAPSPLGGREVAISVRWLFSRLFSTSASGSFPKASRIAHDWTNGEMGSSDAPISDRSAAPRSAPNLRRTR